MSYGQITPDLSADPNVIPLPDPTTLAGQVQLPPQPPPPTSALGFMNRLPPSVVGYPQASKSRFALTQSAEPATGAPGINPYGPGYVPLDGKTPNWAQSASGVDMGAPQAAAPMTKLGKLLYMLKGAGTGAMVGSTQPTLGGGFMAAQQNQNQQINQEMAQRQAEIGVEQARANMGMVQTPWGAMPMSLYRAIMPKVLPAQIGAEARTEAADTQADAKRDVAGTQALSREKVANIMAQAKRDTVAGQPLTADDVKRYNLPAQYIGTRAKISDLAAAERAGVFENIPMMTDKGLVVVNRKNATVRQASGGEEGNYAQSYGPPALASPRLMADPDHPGDSISVPAGQSFGMAGPDSLSMQIPKQVARSEVPTKAGDQRIAFTTMVQHANLLREASRALNNGTWQSNNALQNAFKNEFGYAGPITAAAIADAYKGEVANVINKGHITDTGSEKIAHTLDPSRQNFETMDSVLGAYQALAQSKMNMLDKQDQRVLDRAQANRKTKPGNAPPATAPPAAGGEHPFFKKHGGTADAQAGPG